MDSHGPGLARQGRRSPAGEREASHPCGGVAAIGAASAGTLAGGGVRRGRRGACLGARAVQGAGGPVDDQVAAEEVDRHLDLAGGVGAKVDVAGDAVATAVRDAATVAVVPERDAGCAGFAASQVAAFGA